MDSLISWWVRNPVAANLLMIGILLSGYLGFKAMEREAFPEFSVKQAEVSVVWPGAAPQEVEEQIIVRIEEALKDLDGVKRIRSTASEGAGTVIVAANSYVDINAFVNDVKNRVDAVNSLPRDIENPRVKRSDLRREMVRVALFGDLSERELTRLAEELRDDIASLDYISIVELAGTRREEVTVELSEASMRRYGLSFDEVADAIRASSINLSSGQVRTATGDVRLRARNLADNESDFEQIIVRQTSAGATVTVGDVARVIDGYEENELRSRINGKSAVLIKLMTSENMQVVKASDEIRAWIEATRPQLPRGVDMAVWFDSADIYKSRMEIIGDSAWVGLLLVFCVLIVSLRPTVALWVTAGIAVAFIGTFSLLPVYGVSLNVISTFAFLLVLGIVVDDAIVVGESIHNHTHRMGGGSEAAIVGTLAVARPVIFAVLTTMIAFAPWLFLDVDGGHMTGQFSIVITVALVISLVEAFLILPAHLRHLQHRENISGWRLRQKRIEESIITFANKRYRPIITWAAERRVLTASIFFAGFIVSLGLFSSGWVKFTFFPEIQSDEVYVTVTLPSGTPYSRALAVLEDMRSAQSELVAEVAQNAVNSGGSGELIEGWYTRATRSNVTAIISLVPIEKRDLSAKQTAQRFTELMGDIPDADDISVRYTFTNDGAAITYVLRHKDMDTLRQASTELQEKLRSYDSTYYVRDSLRGETDEILLKLLPGSEKLGINLAQVSNQVRQAYYGEEVQRLPRENGDVKVMVRYPKALRGDLGSLDNFRVRTIDGREVPLLSVVAIELGSGVQRIQRRDGERMVRVSTEAPKEAVSDINMELVADYIPALQERYPELDILKGGRQETEAEFFSKITALYAVAFFAMYMLIAVAFHSYWLPLLIMTAIPYGFMGAVFGHFVFNTPMAMFSYFGIGAAAGVVINDNLVLVDYIGKLRNQGKTAAEAVIEAGVHRFRPILLTTVTTFIGLVPIMAEQSVSAQFLKPAVLSLAFGVLFALFVTLLMVPALYLIGVDCALVAGKLKAKLWPWGANQAES
jgi:multidrug efflux pump subunit AcrB